MNFKWLLVPFSNQAKRIKVAQLWEVRWISLHGTFSDGDADYSNGHPEIEAFTSEQEAKEFAESLNNAIKLLRHERINYKVRIEKGKSA